MTSVGRLAAILVGLQICLACSRSSTAPDSSVTTITRTTNTTGAEQEAADTTATGTAERSPDADQRSVEGVVWEECGSGLECATLTVPLDHFASPSEVEVDDSWPVALVRRPATGNPIGSIIVNPGGPGASGVDFVSSAFSLGSAVDQRFHLIGFDPRGVGASGTVACQVDRSIGPLPDYQPDDKSERDELDSEAETAATACLADAADQLKTLSTTQVVEDLELLRLALDEPKLNFVGLSYGTYLGAAYAQAYPDTTGLMILDGVVDPDSSLDELLLQQASAFEQAAERLDQACRNEETTSCPANGFLATFDALSANLESGSQGEVGPTELAAATLFALYTDDLWPTYLQALTSAESGNVENIERLSDFFLTAVDFVPYAAYVCNDLDRPTSSTQWDALAATADEVAPRFGAVIVNELRICAHWPDSPGPIRSDPSGDGTASTDWRQIEALIVGTTGDAATPLDNSRSLHQLLPNSALVEVEAERHTSLGSSSCLADVVEQYLLNQQLLTTVVECPA